MKGMRLLITLLFVLALVVTGCSKATPTPTPKPAAQPTKAAEAPTKAAPQAKEKTLVLGFTASQTGKYAKESKEQTQGIQLWLKDLDKKGGIKLSDGTVIKFKVKYYDDESTKERVQQLYTKLITEDKADLLISPYSSGLTAAAAVIAEQYGKIMMTTGAASDSIYKKGYKRVYQIYTPASRYLTGAVDALKAWDPNAKKVAIVYEKSKFATGVAKAVKAYAEKQGMEVVLFEGYEAGTTDFNPFINKIEAAKPDAIIGGGHFQDGSTFAKQLYEKKTPVKMVAILVAPAVPEFAELGDAAVGVIGPSQWESIAKYSPESAKAAGIAWCGPTIDQFVSEYKEAYGYEPGYHAAGGYAAGLVLERAIKMADSVDPDALVKALDSMDVMIFFGHIKFDTGEAHGLQIGHDMVYLQWQKDQSGNLVRQIVWPEAAKTAEPIYPLQR